MMETSWHSYPKVWNLGHPACAALLNGPVLVEEKVDGSQFSFGRFDGTLRVRSKRQEMQPDAPEQMFLRAVEAVRDLPLRDGWTYRGEYLQKPKHNVLKYTRVPARHVILFDVNDGFESYLSWEAKQDEAGRLGLECVPQLHQGALDDVGTLRALLKRESVLGGCAIEGVVVKNYAVFGPDKKALMGKHVSEDFKEVHKKSWRKDNPTAGDILQQLIAEYRTPPRWRKAVEHLRDAGQLTDSPKDIGALLLEVQRDVETECRDEIQAALFRWAWPHVRRGLTAGLPEWYKQRLLEAQFGSEE